MMTYLVLSLSSYSEDKPMKGSRASLASLSMAGSQDSLSAEYSGGRNASCAYDTAARKASFDYDAVFAN